MGLEMTSTFSQENPIVAAANEASEGPGTRGNESNPTEAHSDLDLSDHIDVHIVDEPGAAEDESDDEAESGTRVTIGGKKWSVNNPTRRSTIRNFEHGVEKFASAAEQPRPKDVNTSRPSAPAEGGSGELVPARIPGGGRDVLALAKKRSSMAMGESMDFQPPTLSELKDFQQQHDL